jgi:hypothetical protein
VLHTSCFQRQQVVIRSSLTSSPFSTLRVANVKGIHISALVLLQIQRIPLALAWEQEAIQKNRMPQADILCLPKMLPNPPALHATCRDDCVGKN